MQIKALSALLVSYGIVTSQANDLYRYLCSEVTSTTSMPSKVADDFEWVVIDSFLASMSMSMLNAKSNSLAFVGPSDNSDMAASTKAAKPGFGSGKAAKTGTTKSSKPSSQPSSQPSEKLSISLKPSAQPSQSPLSQPSESLKPSLKPSSQPSEKPSISLKPSAQPSESPSSQPSEKPSRQPASKSSKKSAV